MRLERAQGLCPVLTFQFPSRQGVAGAMVVTLTLCEWQRVAQQISEAAAVVAYG